jgi:hypothetical protein
MDEDQIQDAIAALCLTNCVPRRDSASQEAIGEKAEGNRHEGIESGGEGSHEKG